MNRNLLYENCCPACESKNIHNKWKYHKNSDNFYVFWCGNCGFGWRYPFPSQDELKHKYHIEPAYEVDVKNESNIGFTKRVRRICELNPNKGKLLDIGAGPGHFLNIAKKNGWQVDGLEPRKEAAKFCHDFFGIKTKIGFLEDFTEDSFKYDVITCWDVLEHVSDHIQFFDRCIKLLAPGCIFAFSIPNASGLPAMIFKGRWRYVMPVHLNYFTMEYIYKFLSLRNLQLVHADHTFKIHSLIQGLISYIPLKINKNKLFEIGVRNNVKQNEQSKKMAKPLHRVSGSSLLNSFRKLIFKFNSLSFPVDKGDLVDLYCKKNN